jgi:hypothetical protein
MKNPAALFSWAVDGLHYNRSIRVGPILFLPIGTVSNLAKRIIALERPFPVFLKKHSDFVMAGLSCL